MFNKAKHNSGRTKALEEVYVLYMNNYTTGLLSDDFDYMIDDMKE